MKTTQWNNKRGSVLLVAIMFAAIMALAVASFLQLTSFESRMANTVFYSNSSLNLAEAGVEKALFALNNDDWTGWVRNGNEAVMEEEEIALAGNLHGIIQARVSSIGSKPTVQAGGTTVLPSRPDVVKQVEVNLSRRSLFANGITTRRGVEFNGNTNVDSYESSAGPPSLTNRKDNGTVACASLEHSSIVMSGNPEVWGRVATGGEMPILQGNAKIQGEDTPPGVNVDLNRIALDFASDFPEVSPPTVFDDYIHSIYVDGNNQSATVGTPGQLERIKMNSLTVKANGKLTIRGPVIIHLTGDFKLGGNGQIVIPDSGNASAVFYIDGDLENGGNGTLNETNDPAKLVIYGTNTVSQRFDLGGNVDWHAAIYAPNAAMKIGGNVEIGGAIVADTVAAGGNLKFHYDEDLADQFSGGNGFGMDRWRELYLAEDRVTF